MESGVLWRKVITEIGREFPDVELQHLYTDNCAYQLASNPRQFDVIVTDDERAPGLLERHPLPALNVTLA